MALPAENYAALLLERIETALTAQIALALPEDETKRASQIAQSIVAELPRIQQVLLTDIEATFDGDPAAANKEEIIFAYPGLFAIFVYRIAHELYLRKVPIIPRMMTGVRPQPYRHRHPSRRPDRAVVLHRPRHRHRHRRDHRHRQPRQAVSGRDAGRSVPRAGHASLPGKRHPTVCDYVTIYSGASILGGKTVIGEHSVVGGNAFLTDSVADNTRVVITAPETVFRTPERLSAPVYLSVFHGILPHK